MVAGLGLVVGDVFQPAGAAVLAIAGAVYVVALVVVAAFAKAPLVVYLRYFGLFVLGDVAEDLDLVPVIRREVRADEE